MRNRRTGRWQNRTPLELAGRDWIGEMLEALGAPDWLRNASEQAQLLWLQQYVSNIARIILASFRRRDANDVEDAVQDTLITLLKLSTKDRFDPAKGSLRMWLLLNIRWSILQTLRRRQMLCFDPTEPPAIAYNRVPTPDVYAENRELMEIVQDWIAKLSEKRRDALLNKFSDEPNGLEDEKARDREYVNRSRALAELRQRAAGID